MVLAGGAYSRNRDVLSLSCHNKSMTFQIEKKREDGCAVKRDWVLQ